MKFFNMRIDLNNPSDFTIENVRKLIASGDDSNTTQFRVTDDGYLFLSNIAGNNDLSCIKFRLESNGAYNGYIGIEAAQDDKWVDKIYTAIKENWEKQSKGLIDNF